ncbi:MAG: EamA family transporter [Alphaproteobacteria bacterium]|nr:EamA family transporter [Alphaproteobacteria bacterium]
MVLVCAVLGFNFVAGKVAVGALPPLLVVALRFSILGLVLAPFVKWHRRRMGSVLAVASFTGFLHFALTFCAFTQVDASVMAIASQLSVPMSTVLSILVLGESVRWRRWTGIALAFAGILVISLDGELEATPMGLLAVALSALSYAVGMIFIRRLAGVPALTLQAWTALASAPVLLVASLAFETGQGAALAAASPTALAAVAYTALGSSLVGHAGFAWLLQRYEVSLTAPLSLMTPVFGVLFGVSLLGDPVTGRFLLGGLLTLGGVAIVALRQRARPARPAAGAGAPLAPQGLGLDARAVLADSARSGSDRKSEEDGQ